jgi:DNA modification methylase
VKNKLHITYRPIEEIKNNPRNSRIHSKRQVRQIANSISEFGFTNPVLADRNNVVIAGHGRLAAAKLLGMSQVPTICLENLTPDQIRAYVIADNRLAEKAGWDNSILAIELDYLLSTEIDFDPSITGFEVPEIDMLLMPGAEKDDSADEFELSDPSSVVSEIGDQWQLDRHRVLCGNSTERSSFSTLLGDRRANVVFVDPPYNVKIDGHASGNGSLRHREFPMASGEMDESEFVEFLAKSLRLLARYSVSGSVHFVCMDWRHASELLNAGKSVYESLLNLCIWIKNGAGLGSLYRSRHELIFVFRNGKAPHRNNVQLGKFDRNRTNVWEYPNASTLSKTSEEGNLLALHPTVKPVALIADALLDCSARGDLVLDSFLGSGSTLIAAERVGRRCFGIELDPVYVDTIIRRWERYTGGRAVHASTGKTFGEMAEVRGAGQTNG